MYKITYDLAPKELIDIFQKDVQNYNLRGSTTKLYLPKPETEYLHKVLSTEKQNCEIASQTSREVYNLLVTYSSVRQLAT